MIQFLHMSTTTGLFWCWSHRKSGICTPYSSSAHTSKELPLYTGSLDLTFDKKVHAFQYHPTSEKEEACKQHCSKVCLRLSHTQLHCSYYKVDCYVMKDWTGHMIFHVHLLHLKYFSSSWYVSKFALSFKIGRNYLLQISGQIWQSNHDRSLHTQRASLTTLVLVVNI